MPRRYKQGADGQPHPAFYGKLPEEFSKADTMRFMVETDLKLSGCVSADTLAALRAEGYDYKDGNLVPAGKEKSMQEKTAGGTPAVPLKLDVSVRVIEPVKNLMGFASVKFNDCFVVENLKIVQMCIRDRLPPGRLRSILESGWDETGCVSAPSMLIKTPA